MADDAPPPYREGLPFLSVGPDGHRSRMRTRLLSHGATGLADYEIVEMLLFLSIPRRDTKPLAKAIINRFGGLLASFQAKQADLGGFGLDEASIEVFALVREATRRLALSEAVSRPLLNDNARLLAYLDLPERLRRPAHTAALLLNSRNQLLADASYAEDLDPAGVAQSVARRAVELHATALILATVRPEARGAPTARDRDLTRYAVKMGAALSIHLHDHLIFSGSHNESFRRMGLI